MSTSKRNPVVYAGLLGAGALGHPVTASAATMDLLTSEAAVPYVSFALGCAAGIALSGTAVMTVRMATRNKGSVEEVATDEVQVELSDVEDATGDMPALTGRHFAVNIPYAPRHMAVVTIEDDVPVAPQDEAPAPAVQLRSAKMASLPEVEPATSLPEAEAVTSLPEVAAASAAPEPKPAAPKPEAVQAKASDDHGDDYADVAASYVSRRSFGERMRSRAAGVASVLADRLGVGMMDDLPIIERADGTVGDVGTSWWNDALGSSVRTLTDISTGDLIGGTSADLASEPVYAMAAAPHARPTDGERRSAYISRNVAEVNVGIYPERRTADELDEEDLWEMALKAMGESLDRDKTPVFVDVIGGEETIDEPSGLDGDTNFIPFKKPAGHPEVVDSSTYVDYLIDDEFSKNPSRAVRQSSRDFLRVIQGGSQKSRPLPMQRQSRARTPRHMAPSSSGSLLAKEA